MRFSRMPALARRVFVALTGAGLVVSFVGGLGSGRGEKGQGELAGTRLAAAAPVAKALRLYYTAPLLVRAGEPVVMPVDAVCATAAGTACGAAVELGVQAGFDPWRSVRALGAPPFRFDLSAPVRRAASSSRVMRFYLRALDGSGPVAVLGEPRGDAALRIYVTDRMAIATMPTIDFGRVRKGVPVLSLPWGSGETRAGLEPGNESDTVGPSSFDVDSSGRIYVLDALQQRLAIFADDKLSRSVALSDGELSDLAAADDGSAYVLSSVRGNLFVRRVDSAGSVGAPSSLGAGIPSQVRMAGRRAVALLLPLDAWVRVPAPGQSLSLSPASHSGRPLASGDELLRVARPDSVRLAIVSNDRAGQAVELRSSQPLGEVALAEPDGVGGYWIVVHVWRERPEPADQYQVVHVRGARILASFAVANEHFAGAPPLNRFRLAGGFLYQMTSSSEGMHIVRYGLEGE